MHTRLHRRVRNSVLQYLSELSVICAFHKLFKKDDLVSPTNHDPLVIAWYYLEAVKKIHGLFLSFIDFLNGIMHLST